jgi:hypothetical protein
MSCGFVMENQLARIAIPRGLNPLDKNNVLSKLAKRI